MTEIPVLTADQMREVDRVMMDDLRIDLVQMMENAGRLLASLARERFLGGDPQGRRVVVVAGTGGNGGGGLVAARRLHCWGAQVEVILTKPGAAYQGVPAQQLDAVLRLGIPVSISAEFPGVKAAREDAGRTGAGRTDGPRADVAPDVILDAIIGYGLEAEPRDAAADLIRWALANSAPVLSLDVPSGLDATFGVPSPATVKARATLTLAYPKTGLLAIGAAEYVGELYVGDISVPPHVPEQPALGFGSPVLFAQKDIVELSGTARPVPLAVEVSLRGLLRATAHAHHRAYAATDGVDSEWAQWYGRQAGAALGGLVGGEIGAEALGRLLAEAHELHHKEAVQTPWETFFSRFLLERLEPCAHTISGDGS